MSSATTLQLGPAAATGIPGRKRGIYAELFRRMLRQPDGVFGLCVVIFLTLVAIGAPIISPYDPYEIGAGDPLAAPSAAHWFGTDSLGRDALSRVIHGTRISIVVSLAAAVLGILVAAPLGLLAGFTGGLPDSMISRFFDTIFAFPSILVGLGIASAMGASVANVVVALAIVNLPTIGRLIRVSVIEQKVQDYVEAARAMGAGSARILLRHIFPNTLPALLVQATIVMAQAILLEASFSFLGLGTRPPTPSWGIMLNEGRGFLSMAPWLGIFPGLAVTLLIIGFNSLGDALRIALNPRWGR